MVRLAKRALAKATEKTVLNADTVTAKDVWDAVKEGDPVALQVAEQFGKYLGEGLAIVADVINPEAFVIGGGVSKAGEVLLSYIEKNYTKTVFHASRDVKFTLATLGNDAGMYGGACAIMND